MASGTGIRGVPLVLIAAGGVLVYSGTENVPLGQVFSSLARGTRPPTGPGTPVLTTQGPGPAEGGTAGQEQSLTTPGGGTAAQNRALGRLMASGYGWATGQDWTALDYGWGTLESGWSNTALNGSWPDGAYGIPQAHPGNKMPKAAWPSYAGGTSSAVSQIHWGLDYIAATYGSPSKVPGWLGGSYNGY